METKKNYDDLIRQDFQNHEDFKKCYDIVCTSANKKFRSSSLTIKKSVGFFEGTIHYRVIHCDYNYILYHDMGVHYESISHLMDSFYEILWIYTICQECFNLIKADTSYSLCIDCLPMKIFWEYGLTHQKTEHIPQCSICFDPVYHSVLKCNHYFHKNCFIRLIRDTWYNGEDVLCPICRGKISVEDKYNYFLYGE